jgi:Na+-translocating ferredoxin:NAD+ oxidoreductase subunit B
MTDENSTYEWAYRALARQLDALPNGFPATPEGAELRLLAKIFTCEEAVLAAAMTGTPESTTTIAARAGVDAKVAYRTLKEMVRHGLIKMQRGDGGDGARALLFSLMPFVVGFYETQLPRMDAEMAALFEAYFIAARGLEIPGPSVHRVLPVGEAVSGEIEIHPFEQATAMISGAKSWGVRDCICRTQQHLLDKGCDAPVENCLVFAPVEDAFSGGGTDRAITKEEALRILREAADAGLVHSVSNHREGHNYICNCCTCCCGVLRRVAEFAVPTAIARSAFRAVVDGALCIGCGACEERCQFGALAILDDVAVVAPLRCVGCGQCTLACPTGAIALARLPETEIEPLPVDEAAWAAARLAERAIT